MLTKLYLIIVKLQTMYTGRRNKMSGKPGWMFVQGPLCKCHSRRITATFIYHTKSTQVQHTYNAAQKSLTPLTSTRSQSRSRSLVWVTMETWIGKMEEVKYCLDHIRCHKSKVYQIHFPCSIKTSLLFKYLHLGPLQHFLQI